MCRAGRRGGGRRIGCRVPDIVLTEAELDVLSRCSGVAVKAYLRLRGRMDFESGVVGRKAGISYQALREWTEEAVEKGAGEMIVQPTLKNIRTAVEQLVRRGLLHRSRTENLVFQCVLARTGNVRPKRTRHEPGRAKQAEPGTEPGTNPAGQNASNGEGFGAQHNPEPDTEPGTNPAGQNQPNPAHIRYPIKASTPQAAYTPVNEGGTAEPPAAFGSARNASAAADEPINRRAVELAVAVRKLGGAVQAMDPTVIGWAEKGVTVAQVSEAMGLAKLRRAEESSPQPIGARFLAVFVRDVLNPPKPKPPPWWASHAAMEAKAFEMGIAGARPGEEAEAFKARITAAIRRAAEVEAA